MLCLVTSAVKPLEFDSCGHLYSKNNFIHQKRILDSFILIFVTQGTLYISQNGREYSISQNQYIFLYAGHEHFGFKESTNLLSYYWVHFSLPNDTYNYFEKEKLEQYVKSNHSDIYIMPEHGEISTAKRIPLLFSQLLDFSKNEYIYSPYLLHYSLSTLVVELTQELLISFLPNHEKPPHIERIQDWILHNYYLPMSVKSIAEQFHYNPDYISSDFKRHTGQSLIHYINKTRIESAKNLLSTYNVTIKEAAYSCGFSDEKYFMKVFKQYDGLTPTEYKQTFYKKKSISK